MIFKGKKCFLDIPKNNFFLFLLQSCLSPVKFKRKYIEIDN